MKRLIGIVLVLALLCGAAACADEELDKILGDFVINHGSRQLPKVAITVDDCYTLDYVWKIAELATEYGVHVTFFPIGIQLHEEDAEKWRAVVDQGHEIGCHNWAHANIGGVPTASVFKNLGRFQETLDEILGYHYQIRWLRPPYGNLKDKDGHTYHGTTNVMRFGYEHILLWDVSQTNPTKAIRQVKNGSILLYHTNAKDFRCIEKLIPLLLEKGLEPVTVSELLETGPIETSPEKYVYGQGRPAGEPED